jgi:hypothetical protein
VGNSLIGVASADQLLDAEGSSTIPAMLVAEQMELAAKAAEPLYGLMDRNPEEVARSEETDRQAERAVEGARILLNLWVAEPLGLGGGRAELWAAADEIGRGQTPTLADKANELAGQNSVFHWPLEFPEVFANGRGFDAVVGNPPWEEVTVEELAFYARYQPGLRGLPEADRGPALARFQEERPELADRLAQELRAVAALRAFFAADTGYTGGPGDPDLYKFFCQRYRQVLAAGGSLAVVLPRSALLVKGSADFRRWLLDECTVERIDLLLNSRRWMFDTHAQYSVALVAANTTPAPADYRLEVAGIADSEPRFAEQTEAPGILLSKEALGPLLEVPLLPSQRYAEVLETLRRGDPFPKGCGRWRCFPVAEFHETQNRSLWEGASFGLPLWKGESFDQYAPHGAEERPCPRSEAALKTQRKPNPGKDSMLAGQVTREVRADAVRNELVGARVAFRDVTNRLNFRTVIACLIPPETFLTNKAPYLAFLDGTDLDRACCLGLMNSLPLDWQARRFVERNLNYFILEGLRLPRLTDEQYERIARAAARLSCIDPRFVEFAEATGVEVGPLADDERHELRTEIDARVAHAWGLGAEDLETIFDDFTLDAVPEAYRQRVRDRFAELAST